MGVPTCIYRVQQNEFLEWLLCEDLDRNYAVVLKRYNRKVNSFNVFHCYWYSIKLDKEFIIELFDEGFIMFKTLNKNIINLSVDTSSAWIIEAMESIKLDLKDKKKLTGWDMLKVLDYIE
jgi:hypothetical protein